MIHKIQFNKFIDQMCSLKINVSYSYNNILVMAICIFDFILKLVIHKESLSSSKSFYTKIAYVSVYIN